MLRKTGSDATSHPKKTMKKGVPIVKPSGSTNTASIPMKKTGTHKTGIPMKKGK